MPDYSKKWFFTWRKLEDDEKYLGFGAYREDGAFMICLGFWSWGFLAEYDDDINRLIRLGL